MTTQGWMWSADCAALALAVLAGFAEWRRSRRRDIERIGWVPWRGIQIAAIFALVVFTVLALRAG